MIDSHCHLDVAAFDVDRAAVVARAVAAGVQGILVPAIRPNTWANVAALAAEHALVRIAIGIHPQIVPELDAGERALDADAIARAAVERGAVAIGECGLDAGTGERELQEHVFRMHVRAARATRLPLVVHVVGAHDRAPAIVREEGAVTGVMHSFSGSPELVAVYRELGFAFSFAGPVTYRNAKKPLAAARAVDNTLLLAETDAPDQTPVPHPRTRNEPAFLADVIAGLAAARGIPAAEIAELTARNARRIFATW
jgi:TatD DNase family protein